jgi:hypothetical protein
MRRARAIGGRNTYVAFRLDDDFRRLLQDTNPFAEWEKVIRSNLVTFENSFGPDHPSLIEDLSTLGGLLQATNRLAEAEPLFRRAVAILVDFERETGHRHPDRDVYIWRYGALLEAMGKSEAEAQAATDELMSKLR